MKLRKTVFWFALTVALGCWIAHPAHADTEGGGKSERHEYGLRKVKHVIVVMQENHSFDNYFGVLPVAEGTPYHNGPCAPNDHRCVDGLSCAKDPISGSDTLPHMYTRPLTSPTIAFPLTR